MTDTLVGDASQPLDAWPMGDRPSESALFDRFGVPAEWRPFCRALRWAFPPHAPLVDSPISLRVGGSAPPRTRTELERASALGLNFSFTLQDGFDLSELTFVIESAEYLAISSTGRVANWECLSLATQLVQLMVDVKLPRLVQLAALPRLERLTAPGGLILLGATSPALQELSLELGAMPWPDGLRIRGPVRILEIIAAGQMYDPPSLEHPEALRVLRISGARSVDVDKLAPEVDLEWFELVGAKRLLGFRRLAQMSRLDRLVLHRVAEVEDTELVDSHALRGLAVSASDPRLQALVRGGGARRDAESS